MKEKAKKKKEEAKQIENSKKQKVLARRESSLESFTAWKSRKDEKIQSNKTLYTYKNTSKIHEKSWCPARSMQYSYPADPRKGRRRHRHTSTASSTASSAISSGKNCSSDMADSYSTASFESEASSSSGESDTDSSVLMGGISRSKTGRQKTIQVCCQTLQYWCVCDHHES